MQSLTLLRRRTTGSVLRNGAPQYSLQKTSRRLQTRISNRQPSAQFDRYFPGLPTSIARCRQRYYSSQTTDIVFPDPNRPDLFYHLVNPPTPLSPALPAFALSFLDSAPPSIRSAAVVGWLPAQTYGNEPSNTNQTQKTNASLQDFVGNPKFMALLHETVKSGLAEGVDDIWRDAALQLQAGWMHIHDQRNPPDQGRVGDPDDIIATVLVDNSKIKSETYQAMPSYRVCTSDGVIQLTPGLSEHLREALLRLSENEKEQD